jgi:hypothetical protein
MSADNNTMLCVVTRADKVNDSIVLRSIETNTFLVFILNLILNISRIVYNTRVLIL